MMDKTLDRQLAQIQKNRTKSSRLKTIGPMVQAVVKQSFERGVEPAVRVAQLLAPVVDEYFRSHCRVGTVNSVEVMIHVDEASMAFHMNKTWTRRIVEALSVGAARGRITNVRFAHGRGGIAIPFPQTDVHTRKRSTIVNQSGCN